MTGPSEPDGESGRWLRRKSECTTPSHTCRPPDVIGSFDRWSAGQVGDVWQCAVCSAVYVTKFVNGRPRWRRPRPLSLTWWRYGA